MKNYFKHRISGFATIFALIILAVIFLYAYQDQFHSYLRFSDGAKFADIARNIYYSLGYNTSFNFFDSFLLNTQSGSLFSGSSIPPLMPYSILASFHLFGVNDFSVIFTSSAYFILSVLLSYLIGRRLFGQIPGILGSVAVMANLSFLDYATSGASEALFTFLVLLCSYLYLLKKKGFLLFASPVFLLLYLARPQAIVFIFGFIVVEIHRMLGIRKSLVVGMLLLIALFILDRLIIYPLSYRYGFMPLFERGIQAIRAHGATQSPSDVLRGSSSGDLSNLNILKKLFYNLYNFYRSFPNIASPYLGALFVIGLFIKEKAKDVRQLRLYTLFVFSSSLAVAAITIPFYRYIHPALPLVYIFAVGALYKIISNTSRSSSRASAAILVSLVLLFSVGQSLGVLLLDRRFKQNEFNLHMPPGYVLLSEEYKNKFPTTGLVLTNLDTWLSWYGETKSMWLPLEPNMLPSDTQAAAGIEAVFLTNYLAEDDNYRLSEAWQRLLQSPESISETELGNEFEYVGRVDLESQKVYENKKYFGVIFMKK